MAGEAAGFWSYVQEDDKGDAGRISMLAADLRAEYRIQTGEDLELFVDRESLKWGEAWEQRIEDAIAGTTFFIPVITPSYFQSSACRQEFLKFVREAERLGLTQLLMSVYWVPVPALEASPEESGDEVTRHVAKYQWQDLREERFEERDSSAYRKAVSALAAEIVSRAAGAEDIDDVPVAGLTVAESSEESNDDELGLMDRIAKGEDAMPRITELLGEIGEGIEAVGTVTEHAGQEIDAASARGQGMKAALTLTNRLAQELDGPTSLIEDRGYEYATALVEADSAIHAWLDLIEAEEKPDDEKLTFLKQVIEMVTASDGASEVLQSLTDNARTMATYSRSLRAPVKKMRNGLNGVLDGKAIVDEWGRRASGILENSTGGKTQA